MHREQPVSPVPEIDDPESFEEHLSAPGNRFRIEALEPRILLSADPISGEFARVIQESFDDSADEDIAAIMQDVTEVAEVHSATQFDSIEDDLSFAWPDGWDDAQDDVRDEASAETEQVEQAVAVDAVDAVMLQQTTTVSPNSWLETANILFALDANSLRSGSGEPSPISNATESHEPASSDADFDHDVRGPPVNQWLTALDTIYTSGYAPERVSLDASKEAQNSYFNLSDEPFGRLALLEDHLARGPPSTGDNLLIATVNTGTPGAELDLSDPTIAASVDSLVDQALVLWQAYADETGDAELQAALAGLGTLVIRTDTDGTFTQQQLANASGDTITLDTDAGGYGWFIDPTPDTNEEFETVTGSDTLTAIAGGEGENGVDLLTVLLHEIGHLLGYGHDAANDDSLMAESLEPGTRLLPQANDAHRDSHTETTGNNLLVDNGDTTFTLDLSGAADDARAVTVAVNADGTINISNSAADDGTNVANVVNIIGNSSGTLEIQGPNVDAVWTFDTATAGTIALAGGATIGFSNVTTVVGGSANDEFHVSNDHTANLDITAGAGDDTLVVKTGTNLTIDFDGGIGTADTIVNQDGNAGTINATGVETLIDRPLLFIPGFGGTFADTSLPDDPSLDGSGPLEEWLLNRGLDPARLVLEPLMEAYSDIVQTFVNIGYTDGTNDSSVSGTLFSVLWDYRVPVAVADAVENGILDSVDVNSLIDASFDTALDYLSYFMDQAVAAWTELTGSAPDSVDLVTHSTGGLVAKSYIQSAAYTETKGAGSEHLLPINMLIQTGVPNQGTGAPFAFLNNDFSLKSATRLLATILNDAYTLHTSGTTINNPDDSPLAATTPEEFVAAYIATFKDLMATYEFLDDIDNANEVFTALPSANNAYNDLLNDLNAYDVDAFVARGQLDVVADGLIADLSNADSGGDGIVTEAELLALYDAVANGGNGDGKLDTSETPAALDAADTGNDLGGAADNIVSYAELLRLFDKQTYIVYSDQVDTPDLAIKRTGPVTSLGLKNELLPFDDTLIGVLPAIGDEWYEIRNHPSDGDGTVSAFSASSGFADFRVKEVSAVAGKDIEHTGITHNVDSQRLILELLGVTDETVATVSTGLLLTTAQSGVRLIELGIVDPVELATDLYDETVAKINGLIGTINGELNQDLPFLGQSISDLIGAEIPALNLDGFIAGLSLPINDPTGVTPQDQLTDLEFKIETALGLSAGELSFNSIADILSLIHI